MTLPTDDDDEPVSPELETSIKGARGNGRALPHPLQGAMGQAFNANLSGVRIHTNAQADRLNRTIQARAFTTGTDIFFRQGEYKPASRSGQELLAHELTHVVQQSGGSLQNRNNSRSGQPQQFSTTTNRSIEPVIQKYEFINGGRDYTSAEDVYADIETAIEEDRIQGIGGVISEIDDPRFGNDEIFPNEPSGSSFKGTLSEVFPRHRSEALALIKSWMSVSQYQSVRMLKSQIYLHRKFPHLTDMAVYILAQIHAQPVLLAENQLAKQAINNDYISGQLNSLIPKLVQRFEHHTHSTIAREFKTFHKGRYWPWYIGRFRGAFQYPERYSIATKIAAIHDLSDYYHYTKNNNSFPYQHITHVPEEKAVASNKEGEKESFLNARDNDGIGPQIKLREIYPIMRAARIHNKPVQGGPSLTTGRLMQMSRDANATVEELEAVAWAIFAFWNQSYTTSASGIHHFHFVMDMASNYGVDYDIRRPLPDRPPGPPTLAPAPARPAGFIGLRGGLPGF